MRGLAFALDACSAHRTSQNNDAAPVRKGRRRRSDGDAFHPSHRWGERADGTAWCIKCFVLPDWPLSSQQCTRCAVKEASPKASKLRAVREPTEAHDSPPTAEETV